MGQSFSRIALLLSLFSVAAGPQLWAQSAQVRAKVAQDLPPYVPAVVLAGAVELAGTDALVDLGQEWNRTFNLIQHEAGITYLPMLTRDALKELVAGKRSMELAPVSQLRALTGYVRGGVTALAAKRDYPVYLDESALRHSQMAASAGVRGTQILLAPADYLRATRATVGPLARKVAGT